MTCLGVVPAACQAASRAVRLTPGNRSDHPAVSLIRTRAVPTSGSLPKPTSADDKAVTNVRNPINVRDDVVRIDHKFNDKWTILGHYMDDYVTQGYAQPELGWLWASYNTVTSTLSNPSNSAAIKLSGTINPNLLVEASINYDGNVINITNSSNWRIFLPAGA